MKIFSMISSIGVAGDAMWVRISTIARELKNNNNEVSLYHYILKVNRSKHKPLFSNAATYEKEYGVNNTRVCNFFSIFSQFLKDIKSEKYDIIYGNTFMGAIIPILTKKYHNLPIILDVHGLLTEEYKLKPRNKTYFFASLFNHFLEYMCFKYADGFFCVSNKMIEYLHTKKGTKANKLYYIPNGVDLDFFQSSTNEDTKSLRKKLGIENKFVFGYIGGSQGWQGLDNYISATKEIERDDVIFLFVGTGKQGREKNSIFLPAVDRKHVPLYYSLCDVLVLPRPKYNATIVAAPTKFAEYVSMSKPVLTTNVGDAAESVKKWQNGIVVEDNSVENLKKGLMDFLILDKPEIVEMGQRSRSLAEKEFDWAKISDKVIDALSKNLLEN